MALIQAIKSALLVRHVIKRVKNSLRGAYRINGEAILSEVSAVQKVEHIVLTPEQEVAVLTALTSHYFGC